MDIAIYTFNSSTDTLPTFNDGYVIEKTESRTIFVTMTESTFNIPITSLDDIISIEISRYEDNDNYQKIVESNSDYIRVEYEASTSGPYIRIDSTGNCTVGSSEPWNSNEDIIIKYKVDAYTYTDVDNGDGTITRTITSDTLPSSISFRSKTGLVSLSYLDTSNVTYMSHMFLYCSNLTSIDVSSFDTSKVTTIGSMFYECTKLASIEGLNTWNTSNVTEMSDVFYNCKSLTSLDLSSFDTSNVTNMSSMFYYCSKLTSLDLSSFDTSNVTYMNSMLTGCNNLTSVDMDNSDINSINRIIIQLPTRTSDSPGTMTIGSLSGSTKLRVGNGWAIKSNTTLSKEIFKFTSNFNNLGCNFNNSLVYSVNDAVNSDGTITRTITSDSSPSSISFRDNDTITSLIINSVDCSNITSMFAVFRNCTKLTSIDLSNWDTKNLTSMSHMFNKCTKLTTIEGLSSFDTSNVTTMEQMFNKCSNLTSLDLSSFDTSNVTDMQYMFSECSSLTSLDLSSFDTSNVTAMQYMFNKCSNLTSLDLSSFDTSNVTYIYNMFNNCNKLISLDISNWDISKVTDYNLSDIFYKCSNLTSINMDGSNTSSVNKIITQLPTRTVDSYGTMTVSKNVLNSVNTTSANSKYWNIIKTPEYSFTLDTLKYLLIKLKEKFALKAEGDLKVDKVDGKDLVTNDYTYSYVQINQNALNDVFVSSKTDTEIQLVFESNYGDNIITIPYDKYKKSALFVDCEENFDCYEGDEYSINYRYASAIKEGTHKLTVEILRNNEVIKNETDIADDYLYIPNLNDTEIRMYATDPEGTKTGVTYLKPNVKP